MPSAACSELSAAAGAAGAAGASAAPAVVALAALGGSWTPSAKARFSNAIPSKAGWSRPMKTRISTKPKRSAATPKTMIVMGSSTKAATTAD